MPDAGRARGSERVPLPEAVPHSPPRRTLPGTEVVRSGARRRKLEGLGRVVAAPGGGYRVTRLLDEMNQDA